MSRRARYPSDSSMDVPKETKSRKEAEAREVGV